MRPKNAPEPNLTSLIVCSSVIFGFNVVRYLLAGLSVRRRLACGSVSSASGVFLQASCEPGVLQ